MEYLDIVDSHGQPTGKTVEREYAHTYGVRHRTAHLWLLRRVGDGLQILLQRRCEEKDSHPGCYDISSAGHIPAGSDYIPSALRELKDELGLDANPDELIFCGQRRFFHCDVFHGRPFLDNQVSNVYCLWRDVEPEDLTLQTSEVSAVRWMPLEECIQGVRAGSFPNCIALEELEMVAAAAQ